jgi:hypothetical protein
MTDRDSVTAGEFYKRPDARTPPVENRVSLRRREQCSNLRRIAPSRRCDNAPSRHHDKGTALSADGAPGAAAIR